MTEIVLRVQTSQPRLDRYLATQCAELSRSMAQRLIKEGRVLVNGLPVKASYAPVPGDEIRVHLPAVEQPVGSPKPQDIPLRILYEDANLLVIDKPAGMVVHPAPGHSGGTLVNALLAYRPEIAQADLDPQRPGIVHRLDRETSGVLVVAATREAQAALQKAFKSRQVRKTYLVLVHGRLSPDRGAIEAPIGRDPRQRTRMAVVGEGGRYARTAYRVLESWPESSLVEADLLTGRTHQLRVHFASIGHPVVGDRLYGPRRPAISAPRQCLHAWRLSFAHPISGTPMTFTADLPEDLLAVVQGLRQKQRS